MFSPTRDLGISSSHFVSALQSQLLCQFTADIADIHGTRVPGKADSRVVLKLALF
jgi:hypothetical protein